MVFYKMQQGQHEFFFQLASLEVKEDFALWDLQNNKFIRQVEGVNDVNDLRFMQKDLFAQRYPHLRKKSQYIRDIIINLNGTPTLYSFGFSKSAHNQLYEEIRIRQQLGKDPLDYIYKYRKTGSGLTTTHIVVIMEEVGKPTKVLNPNISSGQQQNIIPLSQPQKPLEQPTIKLEVPSVSKLQLTPQEQQVLDLFNQDTQMYGLDYFIQVFNATMSKHFNLLLMPDRIKQIYKENYVRFSK